MKGVSRHMRPPKREERAQLAAAASPWPFERVLCNWVPSRVVEVPRVPEDEVRRVPLWITHFRVPHSVASDAAIDLEGEMSKAAFMQALGILSADRRPHEA